MGARGDRYARRDQVECGFRVVDGQQAGLGGGWRHGVATVVGKDVTFVGTVGGVRFLKRRPVAFVVERVLPGAERQSTAVEILSVNSTSRMVLVKTATATLEWALPADCVDWVVERVS